MQGLYILRYSFTDTVTKHENSAYGCFPRLGLSLDLWDRNKCFNDELLKCLVPRATTEFKQSYIHKSIPTNTPAQSRSHSLK